MRRQFPELAGERISLGSSRTLHLKTQTPTPAKKNNEIKKGLQCISVSVSQPQTPPDASLAPHAHSKRSTRYHKPPPLQHRGRGGWTART